MFSIVIVPRNSIMIKEGKKFISVFNKPLPDFGSRLGCQVQAKELLVEMIYI
jgi:hypothetical protein